MPKNRSHGRKGKQKERIVRAAKRRARQSGTYLNPGDPDFKSFANQLALQGLELKDVPGDGNCLFRALSDQLRDGHSSHQAIRRSVVTYMRENRDHFAPFLEGDVPFDDYLSELARDGEYAGNDAIVAFSRCYGVHVVIHQLNEPRWEVHAPSSAPTTKTVHIAYLNGDHYCSVQSISPAESAVPLPLLQLTGDTGKGEEKPHTSKQELKSTSHFCEPTSLSLTERVAVSTGCKDTALVEQCLRENSYDTELAIVEVLQLMALGDDTPPALPGQQLPSTHLHSPSCRPSAQLTASASPCHGGRCSSEKPVTSSSSSKPQLTTSCAGSSSKKPPKQPHHQQRRLSNRERKEQAKADRKQRREDERKGNRTKSKEETASDPVGATAI